MLNLKGYFIGSRLAGIEDQDQIKLGAIQIAAKIQELLMVSSLASTVFHIVRHALLKGDGLPLELIASGFKFSRMSFLVFGFYWCG